MPPVAGSGCIVHGNPPNEVAEAGGVEVVNNLSSFVTHPEQIMKV